MSGPLILPFGGKAPKIHDTAFIAPGAVVVGDVEIGPEASIWYNCVVRADVNRIVIGARSNVQDGTVIHCESPGPGHPEGFPTLIGEDVLIGHLAMVHGCILEDRAFVGLGAIVMDGGRIGSDGMLAAGAMLTGGKVIEPRQLWVGRPAKYVRDLPDKAIAEMRKGVEHYVENAKAHAATLTDGAAED